MGLQLSSSMNKAVESEKEKPKTSKFHIDNLPKETLGQIIRELSVVDRLQCEGVSRRWRWTVEALGWTGQWKLNSDIIFEGVSERRRQGLGNDFLVGLLHRTGANLRSLDLRFDWRVKMTTEVCQSLHFTSKLVKLYAVDFDLSDFVYFLPPTLRELHAGQFGTETTTTTLVRRCPNLDSVYFRGYKFIEQLSAHFLLKYPKLQKLGLRGINELGRGDWNFIGQLEELVELYLYDLTFFGDRALAAVAAGCRRLRSIHICDIGVQLMEATLSKLGELPELEELTVVWLFHFSDSALKAIARRGKLKKLAILSSTDLTDEGIRFLLDRCKSLTVLGVDECPLITEHSLEAVVAEVNRRHQKKEDHNKDGAENEQLKKKISEKGSDLFVFHCWNTGIDWFKARETTVENPWLTLTRDPSIYNRKITLNP